MKMKLNNILIGLALFFIVLLLGTVAYVTVIQPNIGGPKVKGLDIIGGVGYDPSTGATPSPANVAAGQPQALQFYLSDALGSGSIDAANLTVYNIQNLNTDNLVTSSGSASTGSQWTPGQRGYVDIYKSGYVSKTVEFVVPQTATIGQYGQPSYYIPLSTKTLGTWTIKCEDNLGNTYTTGQSINFTTLDTNTVTLTFTIRNSETNTGWVTSFDKLNNVNQACGVTMYTTGSSVSLPGGISGGSSAQTFPRGTNTYWSTVLSDDSLTNQKVGQTQTLAGVSVITVQVNQAALTAGNEQTFVMALVGPFDSGYYQSNGVGGPNAADQTTFTWVAAA
jgi:hypothetical protein